MSGDAARCPIVFVTGNQGKLAEVRRCLANTNSEASIAIEAMELDLPELQCATAQEVSRAKALAAYDAVMQRNKSNSDSVSLDNVAVLVEDTSLEFDALGGLPGPYIKWFLQRLQPDGVVRMTDGFAIPGDALSRHRRATARCIFAYCRREEPNGPAVVRQFEGECKGMLVSPPRGTHGFGWDGIFAPDEQDVPNARTYAEMTMAEKNAISHRGRGLAALTRYLTHAESKQL